MAWPDVLPDGTWEIAGEGPCFTWPLARGCHRFPEDVAAWDEAMVWSVELATDLLWGLTAGRFGLCVETVRPCRRAVVPRSIPLGGSGWVPQLDHGRWINVACGHTNGCACDGAPEIRLPGPVHLDLDHPVTVTIDGEELPDGAYTLFDANRLVRIDGQRWPFCQKLDQPLTEPGTWAVTYYRGTLVPAGGRMAVATYAYELWKSCTDGDEECELPKRVQTISRQGVTYTMIDPRDFLDAGRTGLTMVDQWLAVVNPGGQRSPSGVWSPDMPQFRQARQ